nr:reverse transcriptase domain-containing protein [Tanacetum cinerariifolium]
METIHVQFDELIGKMDPVHINTGPEPIFFTPGQISLGLVPNPVPADPYYKELQSRAKQPTPDLDDDDMPMSREEEAKFIQTSYSVMKHSYSNDDTCFSIDVIDEILEEYFDALLDERSKIYDK